MHERNQIFFNSIFTNRSLDIFKQLLQIKSTNIHSTSQKRGFSPFLALFQQSFSIISCSCFYTSDICFYNSIANNSPRFTITRSSYSSLLSVYIQYGSSRNDKVRTIGDRQSTRGRFFCVDKHPSTRGRFFCLGKAGGGKEQPAPCLY